MKTAIIKQMSLDPDQSTGGYEFKTRALPKEGKHVIRNYGVIDLGKHPVIFEGKAKLDDKGNQVYQPAVALLFEFPKVLEPFKEGDEPTPYIIAQDYTFIASDRSKICKVLKSWANLKQPIKKLNLKPYLGKYCEANITHTVSKKDTSKVYANIGDGGRDVLPLTKTFENPAEPGKIYPLVDERGIPIGCKSHNADIWFDLDNFTWEQFKTIPKYVQDKIRKCQEFPSILQKFPEPSAPVAQTNYSASPNVNTATHTAADGKQYDQKGNAVVQPVAAAQPVSLGDDESPVF